MRDQDDAARAVGERGGRDVVAFVAVLRARAVGRRHAMTARQLKAFGFGDRELRTLARDAAECGVLVCADNAGYFLPAGREEVDETVGRLRSQGREMLRRAELLDRLAAREFSGLLF